MLLFRSVVLFLQVHKGTNSFTVNWMAEFCFVKVIMQVLRGCSPCSQIANTYLINMDTYLAGSIIW